MALPCLCSLASAQVALVEENEKTPQDEEQQQQEEGSKWLQEL